MIRNLLSRFWPAIFIVIIWIIFSWPFLVRGLIPFPSDHLVTSFPPWQYYYGLPVKNNAMPDVVTQMYPWKHLVISLWKSGQIPLWNPYNFSGNPFLANFQSAVFHPLNFLFFILPEIHAWSLMILFQPLLAGIFTYLFCRQLFLSRSASLLSAVSFMFAGFITVWMAYGTLSYALLWLPLILYAVQRSFNKRSVFPLILVSLALAASFFSGHFQTSLYVALATLAFAIFKLVSTRQTKTFFLVTLFLLFGLLLSSIQLFPTFELHQFSVRSQSFAVSEVIPWRYLITIIAPDFYGNPVTRNDWFGHYAEWSGFFGTIPLFLALFALINKKNSYAWFFTLLGASSLILTLPTPILDLIVKIKIPVLSTSAASRAIGLFSFSGAILAGFGFDQLKEDLDKRRLSRIILVLTLGAVLFIGIWWVLLFVKPFSPERLQIAKRNLILPTVIFISFVALVGTYWLNQIFLKRKKSLVHNFQLIILLAILLLSFFSSLRFAKKWMPFDNPKHAYPSLPILEFLAESTGFNRVFGYFGMEMQNYYRISGFDGYDPLYINRYGELLMAANDGKIKPPSIRGVGLGKREPYARKLLNLMGGKYILHAIPDDHFPWVFPFWNWPEQFNLIYQGDKYEIYQNLAAFPRAFIVYDYQIIKEPQEIVSQMLISDLDLRKTLILEEMPGLNKEKIEPDARGEVTIVNYSTNKIKLTVQTNSLGLLFLSDNYYPGWKAFVDGRETRIYRADYTFRAIELSPKAKEIEFIYDPQSFRWGRYGSLLGILGIIITSINFKKKKRSLREKHENWNF